MSACTFRYRGSKIRVACFENGESSLQRERFRYIMKKKPRFNFDQRRPALPKARLRLILRADLPATRLQPLESARADFCRFVADAFAHLLIPDHLTWFIAFPSVAFARAVVLGIYMVLTAMVFHHATDASEITTVRYARHNSSKFNDLLQSMR